MSSEICKIYTFFHNELGCHKQTVGDGEKLLTHLNSALKVLLDIFPRVPKKALNFADQCNYRTNVCDDDRHMGLLQWT